MSSIALTTEVAVRRCRLCEMRIGEELDAEGNHRSYCHFCQEDINTGKHVCEPAEVTDETEYVYGVELVGKRRVLPGPRLEKDDLC